MHLLAGHAFVYLYFTNVLHPVWPAEENEASLRVRGWFAGINATAPTTEHQVPRAPKTRVEAKSL